MTDVDTQVAYLTGTFRWSDSPAIVEAQVSPSGQFPYSDALAARIVYEGRDDADSPPIGWVLAVLDIVVGNGIAPIPTIVDGVNFQQITVVSGDVRPIVVRRSTGGSGLNTNCWVYALEPTPVVCELYGREMLTISANSISFIQSDSAGARFLPLCFAVNPSAETLVERVDWGGIEAVLPSDNTNRPAYYLNDRNYTVLPRDSGAFVAAPTEPVPYRLQNIGSQDDANIGKVLASTGDAYSSYSLVDPATVAGDIAVAGFIGRPVVGSNPRLAIVSGFVTPFIDALLLGASAPFMSYDAAGNLTTALPSEGWKGYVVYNWFWKNAFDPVGLSGLVDNEPDDGDILKFIDNGSRWVAAENGMTSVTTFTSTSSYTVPDGVSQVMIVGVGAGGARGPATVGTSLGLTAIDSSTSGPSSGDFHTHSVSAVVTGDIFGGGGGGGGGLVIWWGSPQGRTINITFGLGTIIITIDGTNVGQLNAGRAGGLNGAGGAGGYGAFTPVSGLVLSALQFDGQRGTPGSPWRTGEGGSPGIRVNNANAGFGYGGGGLIVGGSAPDVNGEPGAVRIFIDQPGTDFPT